MFDMLLNEKEREKLLTQVGTAIAACVNEVLTKRLPDIEACVERVLIKHCVIPGTLDDIIKATVAELKPSCTCRGVEGCDSECELHGIK